MYHWSRTPSQDILRDLQQNPKKKNTVGSGNPSLRVSCYIISVFDGNTLGLTKVSSCIMLSIYIDVPCD